MEVADFLGSLPFLVPVTKKELARLQKKVYQFHSILEQAMVCFQIGSHLLWFVPPASKTNDENYMASFDHTQIELQVVLLLPAEAEMETAISGGGNGKEEDAKDAPVRRHLGVADLVRAVVHEERARAFAQRGLEVVCFGAATRS